MQRARTDSLRNEITGASDLTGPEAESLFSMLRDVTRLRQHLDYMTAATEQALAEARRRRVQDFALDGWIDEYEASGAVPGDALDYGLTAKGLAGMARHRARQRRKAAIAEKHLTILRLAGRGWTNAGIAARVGCHPSHVSRVITARLRSGRASV